MAEYLYRLRGSQLRDTIEGIEFIGGVGQLFNSDQIALNKYVPGILERFIDGVPSPETITAEEIAFANKIAGDGGFVSAGTPTTLIISSDAPSDGDGRADGTIYIQTAV